MQQHQQHQLQSVHAQQQPQHPQQQQVNVAGHSVQVGNQISHSQSISELGKPQPMQVLQPVHTPSSNLAPSHTMTRNIPVDYTNVINTGGIQAPTCTLQQSTSSQTTLSQSKPSVINIKTYPVSPADASVASSVI